MYSKSMKKFGEVFKTLLTHQICWVSLSVSGLATANVLTYQVVVILMAGTVSVGRSHYKNKEIDKSNYRALSKMECPSCGKYIIPRMISYEGVVIRTACPFCVHTIWRFTPSKVNIWINRIFWWGLMGALAMPFVLGVFYSHRTFN